MNQLNKATQIELQAWMVSAMLFGIGAGALLAAKLQAIAMFILALGALIHAGAMYRIYIAKK